MIPNKSLCFVEWGKSPEQYFNSSRKAKVSHYWSDTHFMLKETHLSCDEYMHSKEASLLCPSL